MPEFSSLGVVVQFGCITQKMIDSRSRRLMITEAMANKFPVTEHAAIKKFENFAGDRLL